MSVLHKDSQVQNQILEVAHLSIPFSIVGSATASAVVVSSGLPGILSIATDGHAVTGIDAGASALTTSDGAGAFGLLLTLQQPVSQVLRCSVQRPAATGVNTDACRFATSTALTSSGSIILDVVSAVATTASATTQYCLTVEYKL